MVFKIGTLATTALLTTYVSAQRYRDIYNSIYNGYSDLDPFDASLQDNAYVNYDYNFGPSYPSGDYRSPYLNPYTNYWFQNPPPPPRVPIFPQLRQYPPGLNYKPYRNSRLPNDDIWNQIRSPMDTFNQIYGFPSYSGNPGRVYNYGNSDFYRGVPNGKAYDSGGITIVDNNDLGNLFNLPALGGLFSSINTPGSDTGFTIIDHSIVDDTDNGFILPEETRPDKKGNESTKVNKKSDKQIKNPVKKEPTEVGTSNESTEEKHEPLEGTGESVDEESSHVNEEPVDERPIDEKPVDEEPLNEPVGEKDEKSSAVHGDLGE